MAGNSPTSTLPGVSRGGRPGPIGSLTSVTMQSMHSPIGSLSSVNGGVFNSGHFKASPNPTPQAQRRRWCDYTPTEVWPATPSPAGHEAPCGFGVPSSAIAVSTSPSAAASYAFPAAPAQPVQPGAAPAAPGHVPGPMPGMQQGVAMPVPGIQMPVTAGAPQANLPEGAQMLFMQVAAGHPGHQAAPGFFQVPMQQPGAAPSGAAPQMVFMAPAAPVNAPVTAPVTAAPGPVTAVTAAPAATAQPAPTPAEPGLVSDTNSLQHAAGQRSCEFGTPMKALIQQLFNEAMDPATLDGANPNLPSKGSTLHGTGRCSPCAWFWKARGCNSGFDCTYCHMCPEGELKSRKKAKVQAIRMGVLEPAGKAGANAQVHNRGALKLNQLI